MRLARPPCGGFPPGCPLPAAGGCAPSAAPLTPASTRPRPPGTGHCSGEFSSLSPTFHPFTWSRAEIRGTHPRLTALPWASAELGSRSPDACTGAGHSGQVPLFPWVPPTHPPTPGHAYLSWWCPHRSTQLKTHPSALLPRVPAKRGERKIENKCAWIPRRVGLGAAKLASGRRGRWLGNAGCCARGSRPGRQPPPPRPQPAPPPRTATVRGSGPGPGPRCGCARLGAGAERGAGHSGRLRSALGSGSATPPAELRRSSHYYREHRSLSPGTRGQKGGAGGARRPLSFTGSSPAELALPLSPSVSQRRGGDCRSCHSSSWPRRRTAEP